MSTIGFIFHTPPLTANSDTLRALQSFRNTNLKALTHFEQYILVKAVAAIIDFFLADDTISTAERYQLEEYRAKNAESLAMLKRSLRCFLYIPNTRQFRELPHDDLE